MEDRRKIEILRLIDQYNRDDSAGVPVSPFIARYEGTLASVSEKVGVHVEELDEFLTIMDSELPNDYLTG
ncbi:TPA: hypothetical protein DIV48_01330 [Candidatus Kaiserbacteria bacterium]|nr:MAG: hypothetical protein UY93_C0002G0058 [Parcubacteria group bacterium GW2011_GWA1_56_13]HCR52274.1 hypothetical protein [Candidatus Kaiserbacteria bacterium]